MTRGLVRPPVGAPVAHIYYAPDVALRPSHWEVYESALGDLSDVDLDPAPDDGDFLQYDSASGTWQPVGAPSGTVPDGTDAGDLLVWDGAAWDVLPIGATDDHVLTVDAGEALGLKYVAVSGGSGYSEGTSFPGSPSTNDKFYRTDRNLLYYYDGTRWLTTQLFRLDGVMGDATALPLTAAAVAWQRFPVWDGSTDIYVVDLMTTSFVSGTNNGSHYWTIRVEKVDAANSGTVIGSVVTSSDSGSAWVTHVANINAVVTASGYKEMVIAAIKNGSPGGLYVGAWITARLVG